MTPIISYLKEGQLPKEKDKARKLRVRSTKYVLMDEVLYKRGFSQPYLKCLAPDEVNYVLREVHEGACGNHLGARSLITGRKQRKLDDPNCIVLEGRTTPKRKRQG